MAGGLTRGRDRVRVRYINQKPPLCGGGSCLYWKVLDFADFHGGGAFRSIADFESDGVTFA